MDRAAASGSAIDPICLDDDDESREEATLNTSRKRSSFTESSTETEQKSELKRPRAEEREHDSEGAAAAQQSTAPPIKLLATLQNEQIFQAAGDCSSPFRNCHVTLREMLGYDGDKAHVGFKWLVVSNFMIDFDFLLNTVPELLSCPRTVFFYGQGSATEQWKQLCTQADGTCTAEFVKLIPSDEKQSETNPLRYKIDYGVHHTKMFLIGFADGTLRVVIYTANLLHGDGHMKAQGAYIQDFQPKPNPATGRCDFENDLVGYIESYGYNNKVMWDKERRTLAQELRQYDFSTARVVLIPSIPGWHKLTKAPTLGLRKLRQAIRDHVPDVGGTGPVVAQFSSMGSLSEKWLKDQFLEATGQQASNSKVPLAERLKFVWPTVDEINASVEGNQGGGSVPGNQKAVAKTFLKPLYCRWSSPSKNNPCAKPRNVPHIKTYYQLDEDLSSMKWFVLGSQNMSKAAWGEVQNSRYGYRQLFMRHWELGVFVTPGLLNGNRLVPFGTNGNSSDIQLPMPYKLVPDAYGPSDTPWAIEYLNPVAMGMF